MTASLTAGRDVTGIAARGSITGSITAARNVGDILTFGSFSGNITAANASGDPDGGKVGNVISQGAMSGSITAASQIGNLLSADDITTSRSAPMIGSVYAFDTVYFVGNPTPNLPLSESADVLANAGDSKTDVLADKAAFSVDTADFLNEMSQDHADTLASIVTLRADQAADVAQIRSDNAQTVNDAKNDLDDDLLDARDESDDGRDELIQATLDDATAFADLFAGPARTNAEAHNAGVTEAKQENTRIADELASAGADQGLARADAADLRQTQTDWYGLTIVAIGQGLNDGIDDFFEFMSDPMGQTKAMVERSLKESLERWMQRHDRVMQDYEDINEATEGATGFNQGVQIVGWHVANWTGIRKLIGGYTGQDPITGQKYRSSERFFVFMEGAMQLAETIGLAASIYSRLTSPCGSWTFGRCFVGETLVVVGIDTSSGSTIAFASTELGTENVSEATESALYFVVSGMAGFFLLEQCGKKADPFRKYRKRSGAQSQNRSAHQMPVKRKYKSMFLGLQQRNDIFAPISKSSNTEFESTDAETVCSGETRSSNDTLFATLVIEKDSNEYVDLVKSTAESIKSETDHSFTQVQNRATYDPLEKPPFGVMWLVSCLLLAFGMLLPITTWTNGSVKRALASGPKPNQARLPHLKFRQIKDIRTGMRVIAENPKLEGQDLPDTQIDATHWRNIEFHMSKPDGDELQITLLRSLEWIERNAARPGEQIPLSFPELEINGLAEVMTIDPCPKIEHGKGRTVTGTFHHSTSEVIDLYVTDEAKSIGTTSNHPFWSETRKQFVQAGALFPGESLRSLTRSSVTVLGQVSRTKRYEVFNLEVDAEHCYAVGERGIVVHNSDNYEVGLAKDLRKNPIAGTQVNHAPQSREAELLIGDFNLRNAVGNEPAIRLSIEEHAAVTAAQHARGATASARDLLASEIRIMRQNTKAPNSALQELIRFCREVHPWDYLPLHRMEVP